jgi:hypothetical protein
MSPVSNVLIGYWHRLPTEPCAIRRANLAAACREVRSGALPQAALTVFALGDVDDQVVVTATRAYVECAASLTAGGRAAAIGDVLEWIRRGLALNGGAIFSALLDLEDPVILERLAALRLGLRTQDLETVCRRFNSEPTAAVEGFLEDWRQLVDASADLHLRRQHAILSVALDGPGANRQQSRAVA